MQKPAIRVFTLSLGMLIAAPALAADGNQIWPAQVSIPNTRQLTFTSAINGEPYTLFVSIPFIPPPQAGYAETLPPQARAMLDQVLSCSVIGAPKTVETAIAAFVERTGADELMITSQIFDHEARLRSFEIVAGCMDRAPSS